MLSGFHLRHLLPNTRYSGQLHQVVINLHGDAIDALEDVNAKQTFQEIQDPPNRITLRPVVIADQWVEIAIAANSSSTLENVKAQNSSALLNKGMNLPPSSPFWGHQTIQSPPTLGDLGG